MGYKIKWRFVLKLTVVLILAGVSLHFIHRWQVRSQAGAFLHQADLSRDAAKQAEEKDPPEPRVAREQREREQSFLQRYVLARPDDIDARERLARAMCKNARTDREKFNAYFVLDDVLRREDPQSPRDGLRRFAVDFGLENPRLGLLREVKDHLEILRKKQTQDGELEGLYALCLSAERKFEEARMHYRIATNHEKVAPSNWVRPETIKIESYAGLAYVLRQLNNAKEADAETRRMVDERPNDFRAFLHAVQYMRLNGLKTLPARKKDDADHTPETLVASARALAPEDLEVLISAAQLALIQRRQYVQKGPETEQQQSEKADEARAYLKAAIEKHKTAPRAYLAMAALEDETRELNDAIKVIHSGLTEVGPDDTLPLLHRLLDYQCRKGDASGAAETLAKLQDRGLDPVDEEFETARVNVLKEKWKDAIGSLENLVSQLPNQSDMFRQAQLLLGRCYEQTGEQERRLNAFTQALPPEMGSPSWGEAMLGIAESEAALGRADDALKSYRRIADHFPAIWERVARLELLIALRAGKSPPDLKLVDEALNRIGDREGNPRFFPDPTNLRLFKASVEDYRGNSEKALRDLEDLKAKNPKNVAVRIELAMQAIREKKYTRAIEVLDAASKEIGDSPDIRLTRARVWVAMKQDDLATKLSGLATAPASFTIPQKSRLLRGLAEIASSAGLDEAAGRFWDELAAAKPHDIGVQLIRFDRATRAGNLDAMKAVSDQIRQQESQNGRAARLSEAIYLIKKSEKDNNRQDRDNALRLLDGLPPSGRVFLSRALIHDLNDNDDLAKPLYRQAYERGEISIQALLRFVQLLSSSRDNAEIREAQAIIAKIKNAPSLGQDFQRLAANVSLRADDLKGALEYLENADAEESTNYRDQLVLGQLYWRSDEPKKNEKAESCFHKATELAPEVPETWTTLIRFLRATGKKGEAAKAFEEARKKIKPADRGLFIAQYHTLSGESDKALESFKRAREERPTDVRILLAEADFFFRASKLVEAREGYQRILNLPSASSDEKALASQKLALAIAIDARPEVAAEALKLLPGAGGGNETPAQKRYRAVILGLQKSSENVKTAIRLLEENETGSNASERFFLAQLYNSVGNRTVVPIIMEELLKSESNRNPLFLRFYIRWLIGQGDLGRATERVNQLVKVDPDSLGTAEMKARLAAARKDPRAAWEALRPHAERSGAPLNAIAAICEEIELFDEAERLWKRFVSENQKANPRAVLSEAKYYGRRGRTEEGLRICEEMHGKLPLQSVADAAINVLYNARSPSNSQLDKVAGWLDAALPKAAGPEKNTLLQLMAAIRNLQGKYEDAATCYRKILNPQEGGNPEDPLALNNLAFLISTRDKQKESGPDQKVQMEALEMINRAKKVLGDHVVLLDTEALIWLNAGQATRALPLMEDVVARAPSGTAYYHLAQVKNALKPGDVEVRLAWRSARELGLKPGDLHPLERKDYETNSGAWN